MLLWWTCRWVKTKRMMTHLWASWTLKQMTRWRKKTNSIHLLWPFASCVADIDDDETEIDSKMNFAGLGCGKAAEIHCSRSVTIYQRYIICEMKRNFSSRNMNFLSLAMFQITPLSLSVFVDFRIFEWTTEISVHMFNRCRCKKSIKILKIDFS